MKRKLILLMYLSSLLIGSSFVYAQPDIPTDTITNMQASSLFGSEGVSSTGAITILDRKELQYNPGMDFTSSLEGNVPGVDISPVGGVPGAYVRILVRGVGSLNGGNDPLIILDGVPFENASVDAAGYRFSGLGEIDANDIESVYFLKDAAATAIYGSRAANGVIVINTVTGTPNERNIEFSYRYGISDSPVKMDLLSADQYVNTLNRAYLNSYPDSSLPAPINLHAYDGFYSQEYTEMLPDGSTIIHQPNLSSTNWYDNMMQNAVSQEVNIGWSGGDDKTQYYIGAGYKGDESLIFKGLYQRANARVNLHHKAGKRLSLGLRVYLVSNRRDINSKSWFETAHTTALPVYPVYSPNNPDYYWFNQSEPANIEALNEYSWNKSGGYRTFNVVYLDYRILKGLNFHSQWSWDYQHYLHEDYKHPYVAPAENGLMIISRYDRSNWSTSNYIEYAGNPGDHAYNLRIGMSLENYSWDSNMIYNPGMTLIFVHSNGESNQNRLVGVYLDNSRFFSLYGSFDYAFRNKYFARLSLRSDASSRFGTGNRTHYFPAGSVAWDLSKEDFASDLSFLDYAKLRVGYGITGNALIGNFNHLSSLTEGNYDSPYVTTNGYYMYGDYPAVVPVNMANPSLGPEKSAQLNIGLDLGVFDNRLGASLNYFNHTNSDQLNYVPLSILYGYENTNRWENAGELSVSGIEASISPVILRNEEGINWKTDIYVTSVKTVLESLPERVEYLEGYYNRSYPGDEVGGYYLAEYAGVDPETGHELIKNPETDENVDAELLTDEEFADYAKYFPEETPFPKLYGGIKNTLSFKGLEFSFLFSFRSNYSLLDLGEQSMSYIGSASTGSTDLLNGWTADNPTDVPLLYNTQMSHRVTTRFLHDASYVRLQSVKVGYTLPVSISERLFMKKTRIYLSGQNLLTFTDFPGYDPNGIHSTFNSMSNLDSGLLYFDPPQPRIFMIGIDFIF